MGPFVVKLSTLRSHGLTRKFVEDKEIILRFVTTNEQVVDIFTKTILTEKLIYRKKNLQIKMGFPKLICNS